MKPLGGFACLLLVSLQALLTVTMLLCLRSYIVIFEHIDLLKCSGIKWLHL